MSRKEKNRYPHLAECVDNLALDNGWHYFGKRVWKWPENEPLAELEQLAAKLDKYQKEEFCCGDCTEVMNLEKQYGLQKLNTFINEVFDGKYSRNFFEYRK